MRHGSVLTFLLAVCLPFGAFGRTPATTGASAKRTPVLLQVGQLPLRFEPNLGQADPTVRFVSRGLRHVLFLTDTGDAILSLCKPKADAAATGKKRPRRRSAGDWERGAVRMRLLGARKPTSVEGLDPLPTVSNYFIGNDPKKWLTNVRTFQRVVYRNVYPGIDLVYRGNGTQIEYDFEVAPGADPSRIAVEYHGASTVGVDGNGDLRIRLNVGDVYHRKPIAYQIVGGSKRPVACSYRSSGKYRVGLTLGAYDRSKRLVVDPVLAYST